jgi:hypothetical protein
MPVEPPIAEKTWLRSRQSVCSGRRRAVARAGWVSQPATSWLDAEAAAPARAVEDAGRGGDAPMPSAERPPPAPTRTARAAHSRRNLQIQRQS